MRKNIEILIFGAFFAILFSACQYTTENITNIISGSPKEENLNFKSKSIPLLVGTDDNILGTIHARVYDDNEYVPYTGIRYWLNYISDVSVETMTYSDGEYTIISSSEGKSFPIVVNIKKNTIYCSEWAGYFNASKSMDFGSGKMVDAKNIYEGQRAVTFDLGKYGFDIYGGIDDAYIPVCMLNQLFACATKNLSLIYNGKSFYHYLQGYDYKTFCDSPWYADLNNRPKELVEASYKAICFTHDNLYGKPGYYGFADDGKGYAKMDIVSAADSLSFDDMLSRYDPETKKLLKSTNYKDYIKGLARLTFFTYGDQHASLKWSQFLMFYNDEIKDSVSSVTENDCSGKWKYDRSKSEIANTNSLNWWRKEKGIVDDNLQIQEGRDLELIDGGKTLIIRFDGFNAVLDGSWNAYYENASAEPDPEIVALPDDTISLFYRAFYNILHKAEYENVTTVLIDLSCNGGGAAFVDQYLLYLLTGNGDLYYEDVHSGSKYRGYSKADLNLDGVIDAADEAYRSRFFGERSDTCRGLNAAILTSFSSFSCANSLPFSAREYGVKILGERSGGGSCMVGPAVTVDGFPYFFSTNVRLCAQDFSKTVEGGAEVDIELLNGDSYEYFYDYDNPSSSKLIAALKELFKEKY